MANGVVLERTTISTPSQKLAKRLESDTGTVGGESMMIQSNRGSTRVSRNFNRPLATSSAGFETVRPDGIKNRFSIGPRCMTENSSLSPNRYSERPGVL